MMKYAIQVKNLTKYYGRSGSGVLAVDHINFLVQQGEIFGFLGPNGAGKTTTQRMLTTLLTPTEGCIRINGHDLAHDAYPAKRQIGLVPEESNVYTELTAWNNLMFTASLYLVPRNERAARAKELLETFGLWEKRDVKAENFSKGMRRRLNIAMAIINHGQIAAIDTPEKLKAAFRRVQSVEVALEKSAALSPAEAGADLAALPGVMTQVKVGDKWRLYTEDPSTLLSQVIDYARAKGLQVISLNTLGPSLEDVFLEITGQQVGAVSQQTEPGKRHKRGGKR